MRNRELEIAIGQEACCGVRIEDMEKVLEELLRHEEYIPAMYRGWLSTEEDIRNSNAFLALRDLILFSAMVALRRVHGMPVPEEFIPDTSMIEWK